MHLIFLSGQCMKLEMASSHGSHSLANTNHFFKIILSDIDSQTKLMIPKKFVMKYGKNLDSRISLKVPNGLVWHVNLERHEDEVWLQDGWSQFARFYSIQFGNLLVFKYRGHCEFKVRIFDPSSTEIDYPSTTSANLDIGESSQVRKREIESDHLTSSDFIRPCKKRVRNLDLKDASHNGVCFMPKLQQEKTKFGDCPPSAIKEARDIALASAEAFKSENPFFLKAMKITHVDGKSRGLIVRKAFEESYKKWKDNDLVHLQVFGKIWQVNCEMKWNKCWLRFGWDRFAQDNSLTVGDVCVFELIKSCTKLLKVVIFPAAKETNSKENKRVAMVRSEAMEARVLASVDAFTSENPFLRIKICPSSLYGGSLSLPTNFIKKFITKDSCNVTLRTSDEKQWPVKCTVYNRSTKFSVGWNIFARENHLAAGDVCIFELINSSEKVLNVVIS